MLSVKAQPRRSRSGCLTCRKRHYKCDEHQPICRRCQQSGRLCLWPERKDFIHVVSPVAMQSLSTAFSDTLSFYTSQFHHFTYQICAWSALIKLPRRSRIPGILQTERNDSGRYTNWANFYLPHLAVGNSDDPLSLILPAYAAVRLGDVYAATCLYQRALENLQKLLRAAGLTTNQTFLRIWSTVLIMAEYEAQLGHAEAQAVHLRGAMTLLSQALDRFRTDRRPSTISSQSTPTLESHGTSEADDQESIISVPRNEQDLPDLLARLTLRLCVLCPAYNKSDISSYAFKNAGNEQDIILRQLRDMQTQLYMLVIPLIEAYHHNSSTDQANEVQTFRTLVRDYNDLLQTLIGDTEQVYTSCAESNFPFSPIIMFLNPQMMQPHAVPHIFTVLMAPFVDADEHETSLRYLSGISAGYVKIKGLRQDAAFPDLLISGFWRPGPEREYFMPEVERRKPDFQRVLKRIWHLCDMSEVESARKLTRTEVLQISWREYKAAMKSGYDMATNTRNKHEGLYQLRRDV